MAQATLVSEQIQDGQRVISELRRRKFDLTVAAWLRAGDDGLWKLYIGSKVVDDQGLRPAYEVINETIRSLADCWVDPFEVVVIGSADPVAIDLVSRLFNYTGKIPKRFSGGRLGETYFEEGYIYPPPAP